MKNKNIKDYGELPNYSSIHEFSNIGRPFNLHEYTKSFKDKVDAYIKKCEEEGDSPDARKIPLMQDGLVPLLGRLLNDIKIGYAFNAKKIYNEGKLKSLKELAYQTISDVEAVYKTLDDYDESVLPYRKQLQLKLNEYKSRFEEYKMKIENSLPKENKKTDIEENKTENVEENKNTNAAENKTKKSVKSFKNIKQLFNDGYYFTDSLKNYIDRTEGISKDDLNKDFILSPALKDIYYSVGKEEFLSSLNNVYKKFKRGELNVDNYSLQMKNLKRFLSESKREESEKDFSQIIGGPYIVTFKEINYQIMIIYDKYTDKVYFSTRDEFVDTPFTYIFGEHDIETDEYLKLKNKSRKNTGYSSGQAEYINAKNNEFLNENDDTENLDFEKESNIETFKNFGRGMNETGKGSSFKNEKSLKELNKYPRFLNEITFDSGEFNEELYGTGDGKNIPNYTMTIPVKIGEISPDSRFVTLHQATFRTRVNTYKIKKVNWNEVKNSITNNVVNYINAHKHSSETENIDENAIRFIGNPILDYNENEYTDVLNDIASTLDEINKRDIDELPRKTQVGDAGSASGRYNVGYGYDENETIYSSEGFDKNTIEKDLKELKDILEHRKNVENQLKFDNYIKQIDSILKGDFDPKNLSSLQKAVLSLRNDLNDYIWRVDFTITGYDRETYEETDQNSDDNNDQKSKVSENKSQSITSSQFMRTALGRINSTTLKHIPEEDLENPTNESQKLVDEFRKKLITYLSKSLKNYDDSFAQDVIDAYNEKLFSTRSDYFNPSAKYKNYKFEPMTLNEVRSSSSKKDSLSISDQASMLYKLIKQPKKVIQCKDNFIKVYFKDIKSLNDAMCDNHLWGYEFDCSTSVADKNPFVKFAESDIDDYIKKETK